MSKKLRIFLSGIANSLNPDGYYNIVSPNKEIGESASKINNKRKKSQERINKVANVRATTISAY